MTKNKTTKKSAKKKTSRKPTDIIEPNEQINEGVKRVLRSLQSTIQIMSATQNKLWHNTNESTREVRLEMKVFNDKQDKAATNIDSISKEVHRLGILMEQMDTKIDTALEVSRHVTENTLAVKDN